MVETDGIEGYAESYKAMLRQGWDGIDPAALEAAATLLENTYLEERRVYSFGNGGSASIANHFLCDHQNGIRRGTALLPYVVSLASNIELITAISNDLSYEDVFSHQLSAMAKPGDVAFAISSSGDSENIVRAARWAKDHGVEIIALTGFTGGRLRALATASIHVPIANYGVVEDVHQGVMHLLAQFLRRKHMDPKAIGSTVF